MKKRQYICLCMLMGILFALTGCWDYAEINENGIVAGVAIDKGKEKKYEITVEIANPMSEGTNVTMQSVLISMEGNTVFEAIRDMIAKTGKKLYWSHATVMIISEEIAKEGMRPVLDLVYRDPEVRIDINLLISREKTAKEIFAVEQGMREIRSYQLGDIFTASSKMSKIFPTKMWHFIGYVGFEGSSPVVPGVEIIRDGDNKKQFQIFSSAVFSGQKLIGWLSAEDNPYMMWIWGLYENGVIPIENILQSDDEVTLEIIHSKETITPIETAEGLMMKIDIFLRVALAELNGSINVINDHDVAKLQNEAERELERKMTTFIRRVQKEYDSDIFDFGLTLKRTLPEVWKKVEDDWLVILEKLPVDVNFHIHIERSGMMMKPIKVEE